MTHASRPYVPAAVAALEPFVRAGVLDAAEVHLVDALVRHAPVAEPVADEVLLGAALAALGRRLGHVCILLGDVDALCLSARGERGDEVGALPDLDPDALRASLGASPLVAVVADGADGPSASDSLRPLVLDGDRLYLQRYHDHETAVLEHVRDRATRVVSPSGVADRDADLDPRATDGQRAAIRAASERAVTFLLGGPGTGKTWTVAQLLRAVGRDSAAGHAKPRVALAAPTGKAAARLADAVAGVLDDPPQPTTLHRLLGWLPDGRFRHDRQHPLVHDLVIVDESSMVDLPLLRRFLDAVRPDARVVFVGDPDQLASVEVGSALRDLVGGAAEGGALPLSGSVFVLDRVHRFDESSGIATLADAVRLGDGDAAVAALRAGVGVRWVEPDDLEALGAIRNEVAAAAREVVAAAREGDAALGLAAATRVKVLAATRRGELGLDGWNDLLSARAGVSVRHGRGFEVGRPLLVTENDPWNRVVNGDTGLVVAGVDGPVVALVEGAGVRLISPSRLRAVETWWAMTIHKSQGSEFAHAVVSLPAEPSPVLTRELLYTGVTRARERLTLVASEAIVRSTIQRPVARASGLATRLARTRG